MRQKYPDIPSGIYPMGDPPRSYQIKLYSPEHHKQKYISSHKTLEEAIQALSEISPTPPSPQPKAKVINESLSGTPWYGL